VMIASSSIPGLFPPVMLDAGHGAEMHVDGGISAPIYAVPEALANRTDAKFVNGAPVRLYMVANISVAPIPDQTDRGALAILRRSLATSGKASMRSVLQMNAVMAARYGAEFSLISIPAGQSASLTDFSPVTMDRLFRLGEQLAADNRWRTSVDDVDAKP
jgi:predicted acylesterase/phospholipase RssA